MAEDSTATFGANQARPSGERNNENQHSTTECDDENACCASSSRRDCAWCGATEGSIPGILRHKPCARCQITYYCSKDCQKRHWKEGGHKQNCVAPADRKASVALGVAQAAEKAKGIAGGGIHQSAAARESGRKDTSHTNDRNNYDGSKKAQRAKKKGAAVEKEEYEYDENDECAMCLESLKSAKVLTLPCSHTYHAACVGKLREFGITQVCPLCRADLPPGPEQVFDDAMRRYMVLYRR